jgi:hypothetical protein
MNGDVPKFSLVKFKTLIRDERGPAHPVSEVLHTQEELDEYIATTQDKQKPKHAVAFPEERAIAVALGTRPHGGYHVEIIAVVQETGGFVGVQHHVLYVEQVPHGPATDMMMYPQHVVRVRGLGGIVSFRQVPDSIGHSLYALTGALLGGGSRVAPQPTTLAVGEETPPPPTLAAEKATLTTLALGEETPPTAQYGEQPTTLALGEEGQLTTLMVGEEHGPTAFVGEHPTTLVFPGEEHLPTAFVGEHPTTLVFPGEEHLPTAQYGEQPTTLALGEEGTVTTLAIGEETPGFGGGGGRGPFG